MQTNIQIGRKEFKTKKEALGHYRKILNSYEIGDALTISDFEDLMSLLATHPRVDKKIGVGVREIRIGKLRYNTRAFEIVRIDDTTEYFSYTKRINSPKSNFSKFLKTCRHTIQEDLRLVKLEYFKKHSRKGMVKCQETSELLKWEELSVDHRQPNTFSVIVDRFIELHDIDLDAIEYVSKDGAPDEFADKNLIKAFKNYHREKANLRIVRKDLNLGRSFQARVKRQKKDLKIEGKD